MLAQGRAQAGDGGVHVQVVGVARVHARDHGGDQVVENLLAHAQAHELTQGLRLLAHGGGQDAVQLGAAQAALTDDGDQRLIIHVAGNTHDAGAGGAAGALGQVQPGAVGVRGDDAVAQAELLDKFAHDGATGREGFGAGVQQQAADLVCADGTAEVGALREQGHAQSGCGEAAGRNQAGGAAADDDGGGCLLVGAVGRSCRQTCGGGLPLRGVSVRLVIVIPHGWFSFVCQLVAGGRSGIPTVPILRRPREFVALVRGLLVNVSDQVGEDLRVGGRGYAVAEVHHVRGGGVAFGEHFVHLAVELFGACGE